MVNKLSCYIQKSCDIGLRNVIKIGCMRVRFACVNRYWRYRFLQKKQINRTYDIIFSSLKQKNLSYLKTLYSVHINRQECIEKAQRYVQKEFCFLGSQVQRYDQIPWHRDFRLYQQNRSADVLFDSTSFYSDLRVQQGTEDTLAKDIKVPWELSRFQYLYVLGKAYEYTHQQCYADTFQQYVTDWLDNNLYLSGVNWQCPMEVGIRAINWIVAREFFKNAPDIKKDFWQRFTSSLYDHMMYLENNWEYYDSRTNNHYLSNLVAYLYLCWFFGDLPSIVKKRAWVVQEIVRECKKQIFVEGTSYEGSTHYHRFVTELLCHAYFLFQEMNIEVPKPFYTMLLRMIDFINWCMVNSTTMVSIGDNDSGTVLQYGLTQSMITQIQKNLVDDMFSGNSFAYFVDFGLSIIKTDMWHVTLRHHAYNVLQPTGHFHNDIGSITLAVNGIPVIVDPGSFVYTPSVMWRNYFRSVAVHNTSFISDVEPVPLGSELFVLNIPERFVDEAPFAHNNLIVLHARHTLYEHLGLQFERQLHVSEYGMHINDRWTARDQKQQVTCAWNFTLAPDIVAYKQDNGWLLTYHQKPLIFVRSSDLVFTVHEAWVSTSYGQKVATQCLRASRVLDKTNIVIECIKV